MSYFLDLLGIIFPDPTRESYFCDEHHLANDCSFVGPVSEASLRRIRKLLILLSLRGTLRAALGSRLLTKYNGYQDKTSKNFHSRRTINVFVHMLISGASNIKYGGFESQS